MTAATRRGHERIVNILLEAGAVTEPLTDKVTGQSRESAMLLASKHGFTAIVQSLLNANASVHAYSWVS